MQAKLATPAPMFALGSSAQFARFAKAESEKYLQIIKDSGVKPE